jgi:hypothetical protein
MIDQYSVLKLERGAKQEEVQLAFDELLAARRAKRQRTSDLHAAITVLGDPTLRKAHDLALLGEATNDKLVRAKVATIEFARENIPDVDLKEVSRHAWQTFLRTTVLVTGMTARVSEVTGSVSRQLQHEAAKRITPTE